MSPTPYYTPVINRLCIGDIRAVPYVEEFDAVVTLDDHGHRVDDGISHLQVDDSVLHDSAVAWAVDHWHAYRRVLIRSDSPQTAAGVAADCLEHLGASRADIKRLVSKALGELT